MPIKLDLQDRKLLYELDIDSRQSASKLAKKVGISKQGCTLKINNLVNKGVINTFLTVTNTPAIGNLSFRLYFKLIDINPEEEEAFKNYMITHPSIPWVVGCEALWDYVIVVFPKDFEHFQKITTEINNAYGRFIEKKDIALVTVAYHFRSGYILGKKEELPPLVYGGQPTKVIPLDDTEKKILSILSQNARIPLIDIGKKLNLPAKTVGYRISKLEKQNVIEGYSITVNHDNIGFERYKIFIRTKNLSEEKEKSFIQWARIHPYCLYYSKSIGFNDVELELIVKDSSHLRNIISDIRKQFGELIKSYDSMKIYKEFKLDFDCTE